MEIKDLEKKPGERYLTIQQAAALLSISTRTIYRWRKEGKVKVIKVCGVVRIPQSEIDGLVREEEIDEGDEGDCNHPPD